MKKDGPNDPSRPEDDLFDLPSEAAASADARPARAVPFDLDAPSSALPRRSESIAPAGPPLTSVAPTPSGIFEQIRPQAPRADAPVVPLAPLAAVATRFGTSKRNLWLAFAALAGANALVLTIVFLPTGTPSDEPAVTNDAAATKSTSSTVIETAHVEAPVAQPVVAPAAYVTAQPVATTPREPRTAPNLVLGTSAANARRSLEDARAELDAGRRAAARSRLARIGLTIDAIEPAERETLRSEVALLLARVIQADADEAGRTP